MKRLSGKFFILHLIFVFLFLINLNAVNSELRPYKLINADTLIIHEVRGEYISNLRGNVHFFYGETEFFSDKADIFEKQKIVRLWDNVEVYDDTLSLFADKVNYFRKSEKLFLNGNVFTKEVHSDSTYRTFEADYVKYFRDQQEFYANDNVSTYDQRENIYGECGQLYYLIKDGYGYLMKKPKLQSVGKDTINVSAEKIEYYNDYKKVVALFNVITNSNEFKILSDFLLYYSEKEKAIYQGEPKLFSDNADALADEFQIYFEDNKMREALLIDSCKVLFKTDENFEKDSWVESDEMQFKFEDGKLKKCISTGNVDSYYNQKKTDKKQFTKNRAKGEKLIIQFGEDSILETLKMINNIQGNYIFQRK